MIVFVYRLVAPMIIKHDHLIKWQASLVFCTHSKSLVSTMWSKLRYSSYDLFQFTLRLFAFDDNEMIWRKKRWKENAIQNKNMEDNEFIMWEWRSQMKHFNSIGKTVSKNNVLHTTTTRSHHWTRARCQAWSCIKTETTILFHDLIVYNVEFLWQISIENFV